MRVDTTSPTKSNFGFGGKRQLRQDLEHITQEIYKRNKELAETNKTLSLLRAIDSIVLETHETLDQACIKIADAIAIAAEYPFVGIFVESDRAQNELRLAGWSTPKSTAAKQLVTKRPIHLSTKLAWFDVTEQGRVVSLKGITLAQQADALGMTEAELAHAFEHLPLKSLYVVKIFARGRLVGLIVSGFLVEAEELDDFDTRLLYSLSESIGLALDNKLLFEENQHIVRQLKITNTKLRELDNIKDDFISMASHQLRTPLTSVKGYLSMVLEGDAGKLTPTEVKMLRQAFTSSQRMVYLITDLLNISRLKTGKFIIDAVPTDLSAVIHDEIGQLEETAKVKNIKLIYKKPKDFPKLMLDETKTRQVIMNFVDNAIYYTPAGGHIKVELSDRPSSAELRVIDDGIGVPKSEQHHLFSKFYRATNARKARPDGTGLGLFMAQKVIIAQGGSILFSSKEGQGSTFGFSFPKHSASGVLSKEEEAALDVHQPTGS